MDNLPLVSIVIPAYNAEKTIARAIEGALSQTYPRVELIVVDDGSTDGTQQAVRAFTPAIYLRKDNAGPASARNHGARHAKGEYVFFTDSDCVPEPGWVQKALPHFASPSVGAVAGSYAIANPGPLLARCVHKEILFRHLTLMPDHPKVFGSYNVGVRKKVFDQVGGFEESYPHASGEDNDLSYKILKAGHNIYFERGAQVAHFHPVSTLKYLTEQYRHGFWRARMYRDHPQMARGDDYTFWKDIAEVPLSLGCIILLFAGIFSPGLCVGGMFCLFLLFVTEFFFAGVMTRRPAETVYFGFVTFFRAFARTFGFLSGNFQLFFRDK